MWLEPLAMNGPQVLVKGERENELISIPIPIIATVDDGTLAWDVVVRIGLADVDDPTPVADEITIRRRPGGPPAAAAALRGVPIAAIVRDAVTMAATVFVASTDAKGQTVLRVSSDSVGLRPSARKIRSTLKPQSGRRNAPDSAEDEEALRLYELAKDTRRADPYRWVGEQLGVSRSSAHLKVTRARSAREDRS